MMHVPKARNPNQKPGSWSLPTPFIHIDFGGHVHCWATMKAGGNLPLLPRKKPLVFFRMSFRA